MSEQSAYLSRRDWLAGLKVGDSCYVLWRANGGTYYRAATIKRFTATRVMVTTARGEYAFNRSNGDQKGINRFASYHLAEALPSDALPAYGEPK